MLLVIDVGNTNTVLGVFEGETLLHHWRVWTDREKTSDEYGILLRNLYDASDFSSGRSRRSSSPPWSRRSPPPSWSCASGTSA